MKSLNKTETHFQPVLFQRQLFRLLFLRYMIRTHRACPQHALGMRSSSVIQDVVPHYYKIRAAFRSAICYRVFFCPGPLLLLALVIRYRDIRSSETGRNVHYQYAHVNAAQTYMIKICMKCEILFPGNSQKNINLSSAESTQGVIKVNVYVMACALHVTIRFLVHHFGRFRRLTGSMQLVSALKR